MIISLDISLVRQKDNDRAWLSQAVAEFEQRRGVLQVLPLEARTPDIDTLFNNRTRGGRHIEVNKSLDQQVAEGAPELTRQQASERFHLPLTP